jgi:hypothetical protein
MTNVFIVNPKATGDDIDIAIRDRVAQARAICQFAINSSLGSSGDFVQHTFWAIDSLIDDSHRLYEEITDRAIRKAANSKKSPA